MLRVEKQILIEKIPRSFLANACSDITAGVEEPSKCVWSCVWWLKKGFWRRSLFARQTTVTILIKFYIHTHVEC